MHAFARARAWLAFGSCSGSHASSMGLLRFEIGVLLAVLVGAHGAWAASAVYINEFAAAGHQMLRDEDGDTPDWIELENGSPGSVNLQGWKLTEESHRH